MRNGNEAERPGWFLVKWRGLTHDENTWEKLKDISQELVDDFEATYERNYLGVQLLDKQTRHGKVEYLVAWKGPSAERKFLGEGIYHKWQAD